MATEFKNLTDTDEIQEIKDLVNKSLDGEQFSATDDDTKKNPLGLRFGTRHHMNDCTMNPKLDNATFQKRGSIVKTQYRIETPCTITASYIRIEFKGAAGQAKLDDTLRQECDLEIIYSSGGSSVKVLRLNNGSGSPDGRNRMMRHAPANLTQWINDALKED